jgi:predicted ATP-dependent serine protease
MAAAAALNEAIAKLDVRFGARTVITATATADRARQRRFLTETPFDRVSGGIAPGSALALVGEGTCGKVTLALRAVAGAQQGGATALWIDGARSFDAVAAHRAGVDLGRVVVVRARTSAEVLLAAGAGLRSAGFRMVVVDLGPSFAQVASPDALAPILAHASGSTSALVVVADAPPVRLSLPTFAFERVAWERRHGRTTGWTFAVHRLGDPADERAVLQEAV